jgi:hypothetical protein
MKYIQHSLKHHQKPGDVCGPECKEKEDYFKRIDVGHNYVLAEAGMKMTLFGKEQTIRGVKFERK